MDGDEKRARAEQEKAPPNNCLVQSQKNATDAADAIVVVVVAVVAVAVAAFAMLGLLTWLIIMPRFSCNAWLNI